MMSVILIVLRTGIITVVVLVVIVFVVIVIMTVTIGRTVIAVLAVVLNLLITGPGGRRGSTTQGAMAKERSVWGGTRDVQAGHWEI